MRSRVPKVPRDVNLELVCRFPRHALVRVKSRPDPVTPHDCPAVRQSLKLRIHARGACSLSRQRPVLKALTPKIPGGISSRLRYLNRRWRHVGFKCGRGREHWGLVQHTDKLFRPFASLTGQTPEGSSGGCAAFGSRYAIPQPPLCCLKLILAIGGDPRLLLHSSSAACVY